ncbi:protein DETOXIFICATION 43-like [Neltuma alba]|uniref:protein DETOXIFICATION 43-like n=1 Tax=Neltuma alba TaxID=207710 RepID=UPI0010A4BCC2|nr:protein DETOXIFICATION 43-like [Prosopis alba]XP_028776983.1 protein DETOXIFICATION 43-like [Prosopis alba]
MADNHGSFVHEPADNNKNKWKIPLLVFFNDARKVFKMDSIGRELLGIAFPAALAVAADPIASLIDTAFIGHLGPVELAAAGVSITLFNQASRITIFPLVSITTSFVAEEDTLKKISGTKIAQDQSNDSRFKKPTKESVVDDEANNIMLPDIENVEVRDSSTKPSDVCDHADTHDTKTNATKNISMRKSLFSGCKNESKKRKQIASASTALIFGTILGLIQASLLIFAAKPLLRLMGAKPGSPMLILAQKYLKLRALGSPAVLLALSMQGIFRGFKDTTTPLYVIVSGYAVNVALDPLLIFYCKLGLKGAAIAHVISQYLMALALLLILLRRVELLPPSIKDLQIFRFLKNGGLLMLKVIAVTFCVTFAASLATRLGTIPMAAFQTCQQVWITTSLLADGLAVAIQAVLACSFAEKDYVKTKAAAARVLQMTFVMGVGLSLVVGIGLYFGAVVFSKTPSVLQLIRLGLPFVAATQPINALAFVFDGVNYGASDFTYAATSLVLVSIVSVGIEYAMYKMKGFVGIWIALSIYMALRMLAGVWRMGTGTGPWRFLKQ